MLGLYFIIGSVIVFTACNNAKVEDEGKDTLVKNELQTTEVEEGKEMDADKTVLEESNETKESKAYKTDFQKTGKLANASEVYKDLFKIGVALSREDIQNEAKTKLVTTQFNSITCENEMKADFTLDRAATLQKGDESYPVVNLKNAEPILTFAKDNNIMMRGHTLVWYSQTPRWLFTVGYDDSEDAPFVTREVMLSRMENYIKQIIEETNQKYPGVIYAWDVVNEAIEPGDGHENMLRIKNNYWYEVLGEDYIELAFTYARKYADPEQKLFYNDYGTYEKNKLIAILDMVSKLKDKNIIDGIGLQDHMQLDYPTTMDYQYAINKYSELGLEIQITELDIDTPDNTEETQEKLAKRYKNIMTILQNGKKKGNSNITSVTFWGLSDNRSWLNKIDKPSYPLLFDKDLNPKPAFFGVLQDETIKSY
jgi:endo-1,4-beta-xylanase